LLLFSAGGGKQTQPLKTATPTLTLPLISIKDANTEAIFDLRFLICDFGVLDMMPCECLSLIAQGEKLKLPKVGKVFPFFGKKLLTGSTISRQVAKKIIRQDLQD
jgi:hypothetical protein